MGGEGLSPGDEVGSYVVESCLGSGGMGDVYLVLHPHLQKRFALKVLHLARSKDRLFAERFTREMRTVSALDHPSIVAATDAGVTD
ncbi:MAG TPA: serine/threonine protein kinase, partial [Nakamurella sp.]